MSPPEPLPLATYALALAHLLRRRGEPAREVLASIQVAPEAFSQAQEHWTKELADALPRRKGVLAMTFASALAQAQRQVGLLDPAAREAPPASPTPATPAPPKPAVPSFLRAEQEPGAPVSVSSTEGPSLAPIVPPPMVSAPPGAHLGGTADMDLTAVVTAVMRGKLPFTKSDQPSPASIPDASAPAVRERATGTVQTDYRAVVAAIDQGSLPFTRSEPPSAAAPGGEVDFAQLPLEAYASVSGALARGEPRAEVLARHGLGAEVFDRLAMAWAQRFQREPHLLARFKELARGGATGR